MSVLRRSETEAPGYQPFKSRSDGASGILIDIPPMLHNEDRRPCKTGWAVRIEMKNAY